MTTTFPRRPGRRRLRLAAASALAALLAASACAKKAAEEHEEKAEATEVPVHVTRVVKATLRATVSGFGSVQPAPAGAHQPPAEARVAPPVHGLLTTISCVEGERVAKGDTLFGLDTRLADIAVAKAKRTLEFAARGAERQQKLLADGGASQRSVQEADQQRELARQELADADAQRALLIVKAPIDGTVVKIGVKPGESVDSTTLLAEIVDLKRLVAEVQLLSADARLVKVAQPAEVSPGREPAGAAGSAIRGSVVYVGARVDPKNDALLVRISLPPGGALPPGQFVTARIAYEERPGRLAVPAEAVVTDPAGQTSVSVVSGDTATRVPVKAGLRDGPLVEIEGSGIQEGVTVVGAGAYGLPEKTKIRALEK